MECKREKKHHFVLVHGACHGGWCWYKLATLLRSAGHSVTAPDLAAAGVNPKPLQEIRSISDYFQPLMEVMASLPPDDKVILVGHSMGGVSISAAMERFPHKISLAVFASALMPGPDLTYPTINQEIQRRVDSMGDCQYWFDDGPDNPPTAILIGPEFLATKLYQLCPPEDLALAKMLMRPIKHHGGPELLEETEVSTEKYGSVRRVFIVCQEDKVMDEDFQRWMIQNNPVVTEVKVFPDTDHMVMLCKPLELCTCLLDIAERYS